MDGEKLTGILFDIQGFSVHDGPGCRTLIFLKGCPLNCQWCSNPEGKHPFPEPLFRAQYCIRDHLCADACKAEAISFTENGLVIDRSLCAACTDFACTRACCTGALQQGGYAVGLDKLYQTINRDRQYWGANGGITLTGGEPFFQQPFATALLKRCHDAYIHTAAETCGHLGFDHYQAALPYLDWLFYDLKHMDPLAHAEATGFSNALILGNARKISRDFPGRMIFRVVVVPGYNDKKQHLEEMARFILSTGRDEINLLPLHHLGSSKYPLTGNLYHANERTTPSSESLYQIQQDFGKAGLRCYIGSDTPF